MGDEEPQDLSLVDQFLLDERSRKEAPAKVAAYLNERFRGDFSADSLLNNLQATSYDDFLDFLKAVNGYATNLPPEKHTIFTNPAFVRFGLSDDFVEMHPPAEEASRRLMHQAFEHIKQFTRLDDRRLASEASARTLFNAGVYLHLWPEGNGRAARTLYSEASNTLQLAARMRPKKNYPAYNTPSARCGVVYYLYSPDVSKNPQRLGQDLAQLYERRPRSINEYHWQMNYSVYEELLERRGIPATPREGGGYIAMLHQDFAGGFDNEFLGYLAAYDLLSVDERQALGYRDVTSTAVYLSFAELPEHVKEALEKQKKSVREEFVEKLLERCYDTENPWPDWMKEPLDAAVSIAQWSSGSGNAE